MTTFTAPDDLRGAKFTGVDLSDARFVESDLSGIVMRGVDITRADIDAPWLVHGESFLVNGVDVIAFVEAELDRRFPGRSERRAEDPDALRAAWARLEATWAATLERVEALPPGTVDVSVDGEWTFAQTLRHLVHATDMWLGRGILGLAEPFHPIGLIDSTTEDEGVVDRSASARTPPYAEVLDARADRIAMVRDLLAGITADELAAHRDNPHDPQEDETIRSCLHVVLEEEWEHHRFAVRDLATIEAGSAG